MRVARVSFEPHAHAVHDVGTTHVSEGQHGWDVLVFVRRVMGLQIPPKVVLRKSQVNRDDLVNREDVVAIDLGIDNTERNHHIHGNDYGVHPMRVRDIGRFMEV